MADVMPYVRLMLCLGWLLLPVLWWKILYHMGRCYCPCFIIWQMLLPFFNDVVVGMTLHFMLVWYWQVLLPSGSMEQSLFIILRMADVVALWQIVWPLFIFCDGRCYSQVADGITTQSGWWYLADVITKLADGIAMGSVTTPFPQSIVW